MSNFTTEQIRLLKDVEVGLDAKKFLEQTALGQHIKKQALLDEQDRLIAMLHIDPLDAKAMVQAQIEARAPAMALQWLIALINGGHNAEVELEQAAQQR